MSYFLYFPGAVCTLTSTAEVLHHFQVIPCFQCNFAVGWHFWYQCSFTQLLQNPFTETLRWQWHHSTLNHRLNSIVQQTFHPKIAVINMFKRKMTKKCSTEITKRFLKELINNISKGRLKKNRVV